MLNRIIEGTKVYRKAVVSQRPYVIPHFGFTKMVDGLNVPTFWCLITFGNTRTVAAANSKLKWSP